MNFDHSEKTQTLISKLDGFIRDHIEPVEREAYDWDHAPENLWKPWPGLEKLKEKAKAEGLWNLFLPKEYGDYSPGLTNLEYAPLAERMGRHPWAVEVFNCSPPDTGNIELLAKYGSEEQKAEWLDPLLNGEIRSAYLMTEPQVASSDATNIETEIRADGDDYVINGHKWWASSMMDPRTKVLFVMGKTDPTAPRHLQQSTILVPRNTPGVEVVRPLSIMGTYHSPVGHCEVKLHDVRVPKSNIILGEGKGFEIAQGRLGPGRIHHCMRSIGQAQKCLELMCERVTKRTTFGRKFSDRSYLRQKIAQSYCDIEQARLLTLKAADSIDKHGAKGARDLIAAIKVVAPPMAQTVADRTIQIYGGMGVCDDIPAAEFMVINRYVRLTDGPEEVHASQLGKLLINRYAGTRFEGP
ncbi:MAG: acyl-CoA dehydrogenase family protein [Henriciella sp.]